MPRLITRLLTLAFGVLLGATTPAHSTDAMTELPTPFMESGAPAQGMAVSDHEIDLPPPFPAVIPYDADDRAHAPPPGCHVGGGSHIPTGAQGCGSLRFEPVARVLFSHDDVALDDSAQRNLAQVAEHLRSEANLNRILIRGHTDDVGSVAYNDRLSDQRTLAVRDYLAALGVTPSLLTLQGHGEHAPQDENWTRLGRARNRWVEVYAIHMTPTAP